MKKTLVFILIALVCVTAVSAAESTSRFSVVGRFDPFAMMRVSYGETYTSDFGYATGAGVRYEIWKGLRVGLDSDINVFTFSELEEDYLVLKLRAVGGYSYDFNDKFFATAEVSLGIDYRMVGSLKDVYFGTDFYLGFGSRLNSKVSATLGLDLGLCPQVGNSAESSDMDFKTVLGAQINI